jgi:glycolate oxidase iron-sulfur subunit
VEASDAAFVASMETCVQCRACEPACPSGVRFGLLMEQAQAALQGADGRGDMRFRPALRQHFIDAALAALTSRIALRLAWVALRVVQATRLERVLPAQWRFGRRIRLRDAVRPLHATLGGRPAFLFRGCVMDAWFRPVHAATVRVLSAAGYAVEVEPAPPCCGALHLHAGRVERARALARKVVAAYRGTAGDIVVNSAGCGAAMREYGRLLGTPDAESFAARVRDFAEAVESGDPPQLRPVDIAVVYQAACHLKNVQRVDRYAERLLRRIPSLRVVRPTDGELCCGAGGAYVLFQPEFASAMRERKKTALEETGAALTVSGKPGCMLHLERAGVRIDHIAEVVDRALDANRGEIPSPRHARRDQHRENERRAPVRE